MKISIKQVSKSRPNYYSVFIGKTSVCEIKFPSSNMPNKTLQEIALIQVNRILNLI